eukprot:6023149-Pleurochrysis_carterae.AAC.1
MPPLSAPFPKLSCPGPSFGFEAVWFISTFLLIDADSLDRPRTFLTFHSRCVAALPQLVSSPRLASSLTIAPLPYFARAKSQINASSSCQTRTPSRALKSARKSRSQAREAC